jgi:hypothetical protein
MQVMQAQEDAVLGSYAWVDRQNGIVRIPITRAMELLTQQAGGRRRKSDNHQAEDEWRTRGR